MFCEYSVWSQILGTNTRESHCRPPNKQNVEKKKTDQIQRTKEQIENVPGEEDFQLSCCNAPSYLPLWPTFEGHRRMISRPVPRELMYGTVFWLGPVRCQYGWCIIVPAKAPPNYCKNIILRSTPCHRPIYGLGRVGSDLVDKPGVAEGQNNSSAVLVSSNNPPSWQTFVHVRLVQ